jgi:hypothetical protein
LGDGGGDPIGGPKPIERERAQGDDRNAEDGQAQATSKHGPGEIAGRAENRALLMAAILYR